MSKTEQDDKEISLYREGRVSANCLALNIVRLRDAFPKLGNGFFRQLETLLDSENFSDERLNDAVDNLIKTCVYPEPTLANILGYDKRVRLYTWDELAKLSSDYTPESRRNFFKNFAIIKINEQIRYVDKIYEQYFKK